MASKLLQKPKIIEIKGSVIRVAHPEINNNIRSYLASNISASGTSMSVLDNNGLSDNDWLLVGEKGDSQSEITDINGAVTLGQSITVTNYLKFNHEIDAPVTKLHELGIQIYGASTDGGSGTLIASIDAIAASGVQLGDAVMIQWNRPYTEWNLISTDTSYNYYYAVFTDGTTSSSASDYVASTGLSSSSVEYMIQQALDLTSSKLDEKITREQCVKWADDCQTEITQFTYTDPRTGNQIMKDWPFEETVSNGAVTMTTNKNRYDLSDLNMKYSDRGVITVQMGTLKQFKNTDIDDMTIRLENKPYTEVSSIASIGDTTLTVDSNVEFSTPSSGNATLYINGQTITYTGKSGTTQFTGIPSNGTGSITAEIAIDSGVWQNQVAGTPEYQTIYNNTLILDRPVSSSYSGYPLNIRYYKKLTALTEASDETEVTFTNAFQYYIASKIEERRQNLEKATAYRAIFKEIVLNNALHQKTATKQYQSYYSFMDPQNYYENRFDLN